MSDFLQTMAISSRERAALVSDNFSSADFDRPVVPLKLDRFAVIAEIKERSPAEGDLSSAATGNSASRSERARIYASGGAAAISVLTEPSRFDGALAHLEEVVAAVPETPVMRKDFLVDPLQILEARKAGASGVLLIASLLDDAALGSMLECAWELGMFVLLETFDEDDLRQVSRLLESATTRDRADAGQLLVGVNTRDLRTLEVDPERLRNLASLLPDACCVAESGLLVAEDAARVASWGYNAALVGTALMRSPEPAVLIAAMRTAGSQS